MQVLNFISWLEERMKPVKEWITSQHDNPIFWIGIFIAGIVIFGIVYSALQKEK